MTKNFFRALERERVRYLLISGQAAILYGAATFSEDIDIWVNPAPVNWRRAIRALASVGARAYKLTPPLEPRFVRRGHGFHFQLPMGVFLDVMGKPPRVGSFRQAIRRARLLATDWGTLPVVAPEDLVLLKRTNRPADYDVISNLVRRRWMEGGGTPVLRWALENTFRLEDLVELAIEARPRVRPWPTRRAVRELGSIREDPSAIPSHRMNAAALALAAEMVALQQEGRRYWSPIIKELRSLRAGGRLLAEGATIAPMKKA